MIWLCQCPIKDVGEDGITVDCKTDDNLRKRNQQQQIRCTCEKDVNTNQSIRKFNNLVSDDLGVQKYFTSAVFR